MNSSSQQFENMLKLRSKDDRAIVSVWLAVMACLFAFSTTTTTRAQNYRATIRGRVVDTAGRMIPGARVKITDRDSSESRETTSDADGSYAISGLPPGRYSLSTELPGFRRFQVMELTVEVDQTLQIDVTLAPGGVTAEVLVQDEPGTIDTQTGSLGEVITNREIVDIPLNDRNYLNLAVLSPGVVPAASGANPNNINGGRSDHVHYRVDGIANMNRRGNEPVGAPSIDAIQEFKIATNNYSAESGHLGGAVISVAVKQGGDRLHGSLFEFNRDDRFDARSFFDQDKLELSRNQFGGTLTGPLLRGRTFFTASYEGSRHRQGETRVTRVPTLNERMGIFATPVRDPFTGQPFPNNTITPSLLSPIAMTLASLYPLPNRSGVLNLATSATNEYKQDNFLVKLNHRFNDSNWLTGTGMADRGDTSLPFRSTSLPGFGSTRETRRQFWGTTWTSIIGPKLINEARFGFTHDRFGEASVNFGKNTSAEIGITGTTGGRGLAAIVIAGFPELGDATFLPDEWHDDGYSISETVTLLRGRHNVRIGGDVQVSRLSNLFAAFEGGQIAFTGSFSQNPFADFLLGLPVQTQRQVGSNLSRLRSSSYGIFVQDDWQVGSRLTLNLGLRYDLSKPAVEEDDRWANFIIAERRLVAAGTEGFPRAMVRTDGNNFSPRIGIAYRPFANDRTVIRAGYGVFHSFDLQFTQYQIMGASAFPFTQLELFQATAIGNPSLSIPFPNRPGITPGALSPNGWDFENPTPYTQVWSVTFGQELPGGVAAEISYVGSKGTHLSSTANINQTIRTPTGNIVPFPGFGRILFQRLAASSNYDALQISVNRRFRQGLAFRSAFTWSKSTDNASFGSPARLPQDPNDLAAERGLSEFDRRRVWNSDVIYELPIGRGSRFAANAGSFANVLIGGWQVSAIIQLYDGRPFTPVVSTANAQQGFATRPDRIASGVLENPTISRWFDPTAFVVVPANQFHFGNSGRNILIGPGMVLIDAAIMKNFALPWEGHRLQFRTEIFNVPNRANFGQPDARIDQPTAGTISSAGPGRQIQFGLKYLF